LSSSVVAKGRPYCSRESSLVIFSLKNRGNQNAKWHGRGSSGHPPRPASLNLPGAWQKGAPLLESLLKIACRHQQHYQTYTDAAADLVAIEFSTRAGYKRPTGSGLREPRRPYGNCGLASWTFVITPLAIRAARRSIGTSANGSRTWGQACLPVSFNRSCLGRTSIWNDFSER
jgi:hypothetical protein